MLLALQTLIVLASAAFAEIEGVFLVRLAVG
jgi:hypothetical protein